MLRSSPFQKRLTKNNSAFSHCIRVPDAFHGVSIYFWVGGGKSDFHEFWSDTWVFLRLLFLVIEVPGLQKFKNIERSCVCTTKTN